MKEQGSCAAQTLDVYSAWCAKLWKGDSKNEKNLNIALSSALRQLHENGEISLKYVSDKGSKWILYPSKESFNDPIGAIIYKGVK